MDNLSSWVRQARHRAKKHQVSSSLTIEEAQSVLSYYSDRCAYCSELSVTLDHPMPLAEHGPNVQANILPCCRRCKFIKRNNSIVWMFSENLISEELYITLVRDMLSRTGDTEIRPILRQAIGLVEVNDG